MNFRLRPCNDYVLVRRQAAQEQSEGGILIPTNAQQKQMVGVVLEVGPGTASSPDAPAAAGDMVIFGKFSGTEHEVNGENLLLLRFSDIVACAEICELNPYALPAASAEAAAPSAPADVD